MYARIHSLISPAAAAAAASKRDAAKQKRETRIKSWSKKCMNMCVCVVMVFQIQYVTRRGERGVELSPCVSECRPSATQTSPRMLGWASEGCNPHIDPQSTHTLIYTTNPSHPSFVRDFLRETLPGSSALTTLSVRVAHPWSTHNTLCAPVARIHSTS